MGKTKVIDLTKEQRDELEKGYRTGQTHRFRERCQIILLKSEKRTSLEIVSILGNCEMTVNNWRKDMKNPVSKDFAHVQGVAAKAFCKPKIWSRLKLPSNKRGSGFHKRRRIRDKFRKEVFTQHLKTLFEKNGGRYKRIRKRLKGQPEAEVYELKKELLGRYERLAKDGLIDLYYGDESGVNLEPNVPYGWQFSDEEVAMPSEKGSGINCFGLFTRANQSWVALSEAAITGNFVMEQLDRFSLAIRKLTVVVLDNARIHHGKQIKERLVVWQARGLFIVYLPTYSPHLNIAETVWRKLKYEWLCAEDYLTKEHLQYAVRQALWAFGESLRINFSDFNYNLN